MFQEWGFLLSEIWALLALAALLGLIVGWIIWGGTRNRDDLDAMQEKLDVCERELDQMRSVEESMIEPVSKTHSSKDFDGDGIIEGTSEGTKPKTLNGPRDGVADDLKQIKGIGLKMEKMCNDLGFYHFDQIANWSSQEAAWVDANLTGFNGRVTRDDWISQAKILASGGKTAFAQKVADGELEY